MDLATQCTFNNHFEHVYFDDSAKWDAFVSDEKRWRQQNDPIFSSASSTQKESKRKKNSRNNRKTQPNLCRPKNSMAFVLCAKAVYASTPSVPSVYVCEYLWLFVCDFMA